ncbi:MAG: EAL domain-containing protein [Armatimonas sp.]
MLRVLRMATDLRWRLNIQGKERQRGAQELELARAELAEQLERMNEARRLSEQALAEKIGQARQQDAKNRLFSKAFENSNDVVMITDAPVGQAPRILQVNDCFEKMTGYRREEVLGQSPKLLQGPETDAQTVEKLREHIQAGDAVHVELLNYRRDKTPFWVELNIMPVHDERGFHTHWVSIQRDITERRQAEDKILHQSRHDALTGLPNRTLYQEHLAVAIDQAQLKEMLVGVLFLDIDRFKHINDSLGHIVGDRFLQQVAARLLTILRPQDTIARIGGDEFTILLPNMTDVQSIKSAADRLLEAMHKPFEVEGRELFATASIGVSVAPEHGRDIVTLLRNADAAMYNAKDEGRDGIRLYDPRLTERGTDRLRLETHLRKALEKGEFTLHYQPQIDLRTGKIFGAEALIRWENEDLGRVSPGQFIPLAEEIGLITAIGEWTLHEATKQAKIWDSRGYNLKVAVNLSAKQFADPSVVKLVRGVLENTMLPPDRLDIELTESTLLQVGKAGGILKQLKNLGVKLSVDDFGTGYSSLAYLKSLPLDVLKIDKSFVDGLGEDKRSAAVVHALIELARGIDAETVAEGVEIEKQRDILANMGCDSFQGFLVSPAILPDPFEKLVITFNAQAKLKQPRLKLVA